MVRKNTPNRRDHVFMVIGEWPFGLCGANPSSEELCLFCHHYGGMTCAFAAGVGRRLLPVWDFF
jgi:hypothetical protein